MLLRCPELGIDREEADILCVALGQVGRHYDLAWVSEKSMDWIGLVNVLALIYGPRFIAIRYGSQPVAAPAGDPAPPLPEMAAMPQPFTPPFGNA